MKMIETKIIDITNNNRNKRGKMFTRDKFRYDERKKVASGDYYGGDFMSNNYITRPEFDEFKSHVDTRFNTLDNKVDTTKEVLIKEIQNAVLNLKAEINNEKVTSSRFKKGIAIPSIISGISIIVSIVLAIFF